MPGTCSPSSLVNTALTIRPWVAVAVIGPTGETSWAPLAGVNWTVGPGGTSAAAVDPAPEAPPLQPATSTATKPKINKLNSRDTLTGIPAGLHNSFMGNSPFDAMRHYACEQCAAMPRQ
ncbi:hypothetical protein GCM10011581_44500 [Saccharopolyspora subtropica]|uniref:Uncharacterized protein n=1 Tax=Saccharopolyspora thermophila TaxID=89367 RepID=A0A917K926_9PSEU|nr:hypothetical protein GCM10011581_44500 [Saccharopolyspora subtropica]